MIKFDIVCDISAVDLIRLYHNFNIGCHSDALLTCHLLLKDQFQLQSSSYFEFMSVKKKELQQRDFFTSVQFPQAMANDTDFHNTWHYSKHEGSTKAFNFVQNPPTFIETTSINFLKRKNNLSPASPMVIFVNQKKCSKRDSL